MAATLFLLPMGNINKVYKFQFLSIILTWIRHFIKLVFVGFLKGGFYDYTLKILTIKFKASISTPYKSFMW